VDLIYLGTTTLQVTRIGLGLAALGRPGYINLGHDEDLGDDKSIASLRSHAEEVLDAAYQQGVRYFDAARSYGRAEIFLGGWLNSRGLRPGDVSVGSKWGYTYTAGWQVDVDVHEVKEHSLAVLQRQWGETYANLGDFLGLYQIHSATLESGVLDNRPVLEELQRMKETGIALGLSVSGAHQDEVIAKALTIKSEGDLLFDCVQATWNLLETSAGPALAQAYDAGMGVIIKEALANGRLTPKAEDVEAAGLYQILLEQALRLETSIDGLALAAVLAQPWVHVALSGAARTEHLLSNLQALNVVWDAEAEQALAELAEDPEAYWRHRSQLAWN
jgi:aryl-alcohol dehydrogenase-like predicted oxidoreductase